ncbi:MAG: tetratricopeptide repeat protein, partial [Bacteroidia bacterium]
MKVERETTLANRAETGVLKQPLFLVVAFLALLIVMLAYSNHFKNPFHFDDAHTIENNMAIRDLANVPRFFSDATTSSTLPANQAWRPGVTLLNAIDAVRSENQVPDPVVFHSSIFAAFLVLGVCIFLLFYQLLQTANTTSNQNHWLALFATLWFCVHTANAETINYIIARADSFSTLLFVISLLLYLKSEFCKRYFIYLLPLIAGFLVKEAVIVFGPILLAYHLIFDDGISLRKKWLPHVIAGFVVAVFLFLLSRAMTLENWNSGGGAWYFYLLTQAYVVTHYFLSFILPMSLSADTDVKLITNPFDDRVLAGAVVIAVLIYLIFRFAKQGQTRPIAFGLAWFFIALTPTSSIFSFAEVLNDHRPFFPYIGLAIAFTCALGLLLNWLEKQKHLLLRNGLIGFGCLLIALHVIGTYHRNTVWSSGENLWKDVTEKSPKNGRGWMNYGLALMSRGDFANAIIMFQKSLDIAPAYSYAHINMAIALAATNDIKNAESHFKQAVQLDRLNPESYNYYGAFLLKQNRTDEARIILEKGKSISPMHVSINTLLAGLSSNKQAVSDINKTTATAEDYLNQSLQYYNAKNYQACIASAQEALKLRANYIEAWNNICTANNMLGAWEEAIKAGEEAVRIDPKYELAKNNLAFAKNQLAKFNALEAQARTKKSVDVWLNCSLEWYKAGNFLKSEMAAREALKINPNSVEAWNNVCAACNLNGNWTAAVEAGENAVRLKPDYQLAKNNLAEA